MNVSDGVIGRTWRYHQLTPNYKFGDGMSYSNFSLACSGGAVNGKVNGSDPTSISIPINCTSSITSGMSIGDEILLVIHQVGDDVKKLVNGQHPIPRGTLRDFNRVRVSEGSEESSLFVFKALDLALVTNTGASYLYPGTHFFIISPRGGSGTGGGGGDGDGDGEGGGGKERGGEGVAAAAASLSPPSSVSSNGPAEDRSKTHVICHGCGKCRV